MYRSRDLKSTGHARCLQGAINDTCTTHCAALQAHVNTNGYQALQHTITCQYTTSHPQLEVDPDCSRRTAPVYTRSDNGTSTHSIPPPPPGRGVHAYPHINRKHPRVRYPSGCQHTQGALHIWTVMYTAVTASNTPHTVKHHERTYVPTVDT